MIHRLPRPLLFSLALLWGCATSPQDSTGIAQVTESDAQTILSPAAAETFQIASAGDAEPVKKLAAAVAIGGKRYVVLHVEFLTAAACRSFAMQGAHAVCRFEKWADLMVEATPTALQAITKARGIARIDVPGRQVIPPPVKDARGGSRAAPEAILRGGLTKLRGRGTVIAVVDSGVDFRHPDFVVQDAKGQPRSRILAMWDTTSSNSTRGIGKPGPVRYPNGAPIGTVYSQADLTAELRSNQKRIGITDANGHGTACAGIAAGNGRGQKYLRYTGVAPEAQIIAVRIGQTSKGSLENAYLLGAICSWIDTVAGTKPCVVSCSFGGQSGNRDGSSVFERQLDARFGPERKGRVICVAAGNDAKKSVHAAIAMTKTKPGKIEWEVPKGRRMKIEICVNEFGFQSIRYQIRGPYKFTKRDVRGDYNRFARRCTWTVNSPPGRYSMTVFAGTDKPLTADVYATPPARLLGMQVRAGSQVAAPGTARQAITVGSYDFNDQLQLKNRRVAIYPNPPSKVAMAVGKISRYSNPGPRRDGLIKPDLVAPGQFHIAPAPLQPIPSDKGIPREATNRYRAFNGTSAATPYCAGVIALMLEKNPELTVAQIRKILQASAQRDRHTGQTPNPLWGYGKLNLSAIRAALSQTPAR